MTRRSLTIAMLATMPAMAIAMAEVLWSPAELRDLRHFLARLPHALRRLDRLGVAYRVPDSPAAPVQPTPSGGTHES